MFPDGHWSLVSERGPRLVLAALDEEAAHFYEKYEFIRVSENTRLVRNMSNIEADLTGRSSLAEQTSRWRPASSPETTLYRGVAGPRRTGRRFLTTAVAISHEVVDQALTPWGRSACPSMRQYGIADRPGSTPIT